MKSAWEDAPHLMSPCLWNFYLRSMKLSIIVLLPVNVLIAECTLGGLGMVGVLSGGRVLKNNVIGRLVLTWSMQRSTPGSQLPGLRRQKDDLSPAFLHSVRHRLVWQSCPVPCQTMPFVGCSETHAGQHTMHSAWTVCARRTHRQCNPCIPRARLFRAARFLCAARPCVETCKLFW